MNVWVLRHQRILPYHRHVFKQSAIEPASEMTYIVSSGALNSTHSLTHSAIERSVLRRKIPGTFFRQK